MKLIIVESPAKAKTIQKYLGSNYFVIASNGHVYDLPEKYLGIDIKNNFKPTYVVHAGKEGALKAIKKLLNQPHEEVYLATDPDREGEAISWHLASNLNIPFNARIEFNEISEKTIKKAIANPREICMPTVDAQQARRVLDRLVGYKISPILSRKIRSGLSAGRVQSVALKMIVDREREIKAFVPEEYWNIHASLSKSNEATKPFKTLLIDKSGTKLKITNAEQANEVLSNLSTVKEWLVDKVKRGTSRSRPSPPFMTSTLQQDGTQKLGLSAPQVMQIAQQLYEGLEVEGYGHLAFITYIRTDSVRVSQDMQQQAKTRICQEYGPEYAPEKPNYFATKSQNTQDAHEAIRPISLDITPESVKNKLSRNHYRLYKLIYDRFMASQMTDAEYSTLNVHIQAKLKNNESYGFKVSGKTMLFKGYTIAYETEKVTSEVADGETSDLLPNLQENELLNLVKILHEQKFTKPPARYTDATLIKAMEENGIGRPSTYATVILTLTKRTYCKKEQKFMIPTDLGVSVVEFLETYFKEIIDINFTADMENKLDEVEQGRKWENIISDFYPKLEASIDEAIKSDSQKNSNLEVSDVKCDKCGAFMVVRSGKYGKFLACPNYPNCKNIKSLPDVVGKCPKCGTGNILRRHSKKGKVFYGCENFPNCDFTSWDLPAPILCPQCQGPMRIIKKPDSITYTCVNKTCKFTVVPKTEEYAD
ncbi:MAG: type I DNA topoisomerase [Christensenellaceae bacterium]|nr:type I DNA topoisomerase [Christensenellaceae bacterium]